MVNREYGVSHDYCAARSGGLERVQKMAEHRMDGHGQKLDDLTRACIQLTAAVERVSLILEKQDRRLDRVEDRDLASFLQTQGGKHRACPPQLSAAFFLPAAHVSSELLP